MEEDEWNNMTRLAGGAMDGNKMMSAGGWWKKEVVGLWRNNEKQQRSNAGRISKSMLSAWRHSEGLQTKSNKCHKASILLLFVEAQFPDFHEDVLLSFVPSLCLCGRLLGGDVGVSQQCMFRLAPVECEMVGWWVCRWV